MLTVYLCLLLNDYINTDAYKLHHIMTYLGPNVEGEYNGEEKRNICNKQPASSILSANNLIKNEGST